MSFEAFSKTVTDGADVTSCGPAGPRELSGVRKRSIADDSLFFRFQ